MAAGRKPKPTNLRLLQGNPGKRPLNKKEPKPKPRTPPCPRHLMPRAKKEWRRVCKELQALGIITAIDRSVLAMYCQYWARWCDAEERVRHDGEVIRTTNGNRIQNPELGVANRAAELCHKFAAEFGMTPSSRTRVSTEWAAPPLDDDW